MKPAPLIVSLAMDAAAAERLNELRRRHFPPERNHLDAHLTLFHHLPGPRKTEVVEVLRDVAGRTPPLQLTAAEPMKLGRGVAIRITGGGLKPLRRRLLERYEELMPDEITAQDRGGFRPHVTIQNKVPPQVAAALYESLIADWEPMEVVGGGLDLWWYRGGPWERVERFGFGA